MKMKINKKTIFNIYTIPAIIISLINILVIASDITMMTGMAFLLMITSWISSILLYKKKNLASIITIIPLVLSFIISIRSSSNIIDPYFIHTLFIMFYLVVDLIVFYKKKEIKPQSKKITTIIIGIIVSVSSIFAIIDYNLVKDDKMPIFMVLLDGSDDAEYIGLGYRMTLNNGISHKAGILPNSKIDFKSWFYLFGIEKGNDQSDISVIGIIDRVEQEQLPCAEALEYFYDDSEYIYYFNCIKQDKILIEYSDGTTKSFDEVFPYDITINDLDNYNIEYIKEEKKSTIGEISIKEVISSEVALTVMDIYQEETNLDYELTNNSLTNTYEYGMEFFIEINIDGDWYELNPPLALNFNQPLFYLEPQSSKIDSVDIQGTYGMLEPGNYRLVKNISLEITNPTYVEGIFEIK